MKAVVLRVDSPGGSAFASEIIRRECELVRKAGKPLVVSMSSLAASGGYWISTASDEIWAQPETITGSIGIFGVFPTIQKPLAKYLGIHTDGVGTTRFSDAIRLDRALDPAVGDVIQQSINNGYHDFLSRVAEARHMTTEQVDKIARGRIWSGEDAKGLGLVDQLGGLPAAIESAAKRAKLEKGYRVWYLEKEKTFREQVAEMLTTGASSIVGSGSGSGSGEGEGAAEGSSASRFSVAGQILEIQRELAEVARWNDPRGIYATACAARSERRRPIPGPGRGDASIEDLTPVGVRRRGADPAVQAVVLAAEGLQLLACQLGHRGAHPKREVCVSFYFSQRPARSRSSCFAFRRKRMIRPRFWR